MTGSLPRLPETVWWDNIAGPSRLVDETVNLLRSGKSVCLNTTGSLPFRDTFIQRVTDALRETENSLLLDDLLEPSEGPGITLIEHFMLRSDYRETMQPAEFLRKRRSLAGKLLPVKVKGDAERRQWLEFINSYKSSSVRDGLFLLEAPPFSHSNTYKNISTVRYGDFVNEYDSLLFAGLITDGMDFSLESKRYITTLAVSLFGMNAEDIADFIGVYRLGRSLADSIPDGGKLPKAELRQRLWNAQVQELFPIIMRETRAFIDKWHSRIGEAFEYIAASHDYPDSLFPEGLRNSHDELVETPEELEIGTIRFILRKRRRDESGIDTAEYILGITDEKVRERVELLYRMRNLLAHGRVCLADDVLSLLMQE